MQQLHPYTNNDTLHHGHWGLFSLCTPLLSEALKDTPFLETPTPSNRTVFEPSVWKSHWISSTLHKTPMQRIFTLRFDFLFAQFPPPCHTMQGKNAYNITRFSLLSCWSCLLLMMSDRSHRAVTFCFVVVSFLRALQLYWCDAITNTTLGNYYVACFPSLTESMLTPCVAVWVTNNYYCCRIQKWKTLHHYQPK